MPKSNEIFTGKEIDSMQQPLAKDGYTNESFDKLYGHKTKNPWRGTERDRSGKGKYQSVPDPLETDRCPACGGRKFVYQSVCAECFRKNNNQTVGIL